MHSFKGMNSAFDQLVLILKKFILFDFAVLLHFLNKIIGKPNLECSGYLHMTSNSLGNFYQFLGRNPIQI